MTREQSALGQENAAVYMLRCNDGTFYVGSTKGQNISHRLAQHQTGFGGSYTRVRHPVELVWSQTFERYTEAFEAERRIKKWSKAKKEALIRDDWEGVRVAAKKELSKGQV